MGYRILMGAGLFVGGAVVVVVGAVALVFVAGLVASIGIGSLMQAQRRVDARMRGPTVISDANGDVFVVNNPYSNRLPTHNE